MKNKPKITLTDEQNHLLSRIKDPEVYSICKAMCEGDPDKLTAASIETLMRKYLSLQEGNENRWKF